MNVKIDEKKNFEEFIDFSSIKRKSSEFGFAWLDSSMTIGDKGQNSYLMTDPIADIFLLNNKIYFEQFNDKFIYKISGSEILDTVEDIVQKFDLCAVGYLSYEATLGKFNIENNNILPSIRFLLYEKMTPLNSDIQNTLEFSMNDNTLKAELNQSITKDAYINKVQEIKNHIKEGDIYQANLTTQFQATSSLSPIKSYCRLRELNPSPYAAYLNFGNYQILSSSPERMFTVDGNKISTCPIKGTIELGNSFIEQKQNLEKLLHSDKDKAELLMIVDLMRNDLGKIAQAGTVKVNSIFEPEIYSSLIHLVSDISATLPKNTSTADIIEALLPGGSITGTPKKRAVEIINKFETTPRFVYTGSIGYITKDKSDFNIAIRTIYHHDNRYYIHAGGGIVADSNPEDEYNEMLLKAKNLFKAVGLQYD